MQKKQKLKILICEPNRRILSRLEAWIEAIGEIPYVTNDGIAALEMFKSDKPDIILLSGELKNMGGLELLEGIKKIAPNQATILMLGEDDTALFKRAIDFQVDKYLNKPVEAKPLFQAIESLSQEKLWHQEFTGQKRALEDYKEAIDLTFSVSRHDKDGNVTYVNGLFCKTTGLTYEEAMEGALNPLNNPNVDMSVVWETLHTNYIYKDRQIFKLEGKGERIVDVTAVALRNEHDEVEEYLVFTDDVTHLIQAARKIKKQELDNRLERLNHAKELNRVKDSFLTIFTHELKTPLNSIINFSQYVAKHLDKEDFPKKERLVSQVKEINLSGHFMLDMISNLMEAMKLKDGKIELHLSEINLHSVITALIETKFTSVDAIQIVNNCPEDFFFESDEERVSQILGYLLSNAVKYAKTRVEIDVSFTEESFSLDVLDDGDGFSEKKSVFSLFEQSDVDSMTREATGIGVGLFIVKQLCDRMAYSIDILDARKLGGAQVHIEGKRNIEK